MRNEKKTNQIQYSSELGKIPPQSRELEEAVLGALMLERSAINEVVDILSGEYFYDMAHHKIYDAIIELNKENKPIDILTVREKLAQKGELEECGGAYYLATLTSNVVSSIHIRDHSFVIKEKAIRRKTISEGQRLIDQSYDESTDIGDNIAYSGSSIDSLLGELIGNSKGKHISNILDDAWSAMEKRINLARTNQKSGVDTGLTDLNQLTNGWQPSELVILAARPAMGKTALMLHFAKRAAMTGVPVAIFSLEMSDISLANRLILSECDVDADKFKSGYLSNDEINRVYEAKLRLAKLPVYVDDNPMVTMSYIRSRTKILHKQGKCGMVMIDYLQLGKSDERESNREREVAEMSRLAKIIAKELSVPVILLSQLNRANESRADKKPLLSDLRESGAIEQDADMVCFVHRPSYYGINVNDKKTGNPIENYGELIITKNRNGATGTIKFTHNSSMTKFFDIDTKMPF